MLPPPGVVFQAERRPFRLLSPSTTPSLRKPSCYSCIRVNPPRATTESIIEKILKLQHEKKLHTNDDKSVELSGRNDSFASEPSPVFKCRIPGLDYVVFVEVAGPHGIQYDYQQDRPPKEIIVSHKCAEAVLRGAQVYVPGILACSAHVEKGDKVALSVGVEQADSQYIERDGLYIGLGITMLSRAGIFRDLSDLGVDMTDRVSRLASFNDPKQRERILDMCAAPGGKTTAIASIMKDKGEVIASKSFILLTYSEDRVSQTGQQTESANIFKGESVSPTTEDNKICEDEVKKGPYTSTAEIRKQNRRMNNVKGLLQTFLTGFFLMLLVLLLD